MGRGMNAAIAVHKRYVYSVAAPTPRTTTPTTPAFVVDAAGPGAPVHHEGDGPALRGATRGVLARAPRVALAERPGRPAHQLRWQWRAPVQRPSRSSIRFYDISGEKAPNPQLLYQNTLDTHEFYIWEDPKNPKRALLFAASAGSSSRSMTSRRCSNQGPAKRRRSDVRRRPRVRQLQRLGHPLLQRLQRRQEGVLRAAHPRVRHRRRVRRSPTPTRRPPPTGSSHRRPTACRGPARARTARSSSGTRTGSTSPTRSTAGSPAPATAVRGAGRGSSTWPTRPGRWCAQSSGSRRTRRCCARRSTRRARPTPPTTRR